MMFGELRSSGVKIIGSCGGYWLARFLTRYHPKILMFHRFSLNSDGVHLNVERFESQVIELKKRFNVVPLSLVIKVIKGEAPRQKNMIVLTIDDGHADFYTYAYPLLKKYKLPATLYVTTDFIDQKLWLWPDRLTYVISQTACEKYLFAPSKKPSVTYSLVDEKPYGRLWQDIVSYCLALPDDERLKFLADFEADVEVNVPPFPTPDFCAMTWSELKEMSENGIEIGAHTSTHAILSKVSVEQLSYEIEHCKMRIEEQLEIDVVNFCYPNGLPDDYNLQVISAIKKAGFESSTVAFQDANPSGDIYELRRYGVDNFMSRFQEAICGVELLRQKLKRFFH